METMPPQQGSMGQHRSESMTGDSKKKMKTLAQRRQSAPSLVISKALTRSRSASRESCLTPVSPESCPLVQAFLAESPGRIFLGHAQSQLKTGLQTQERHLFLFGDTLLVAKAKSPTHFKVKAQVRACEMWTANCMEEVCEGSTSPERSFVLGWPTCNCVASFSSEELKDKWLALINSRISEGKEKDDPKTVPLKIFAKDIGNCAYAKTLVVSNTDSTTDVIRVALQQFGISNCVKDHRLWVSSCKDEPPYPLIGHEFPFSIKMSHIRDGGSGAGGVGRDPMSPTDCPGVLLLDQCLPPDTQCQFILKPNKAVVTSPHLLEPGHSKTFKRKRSLINWPFWRGSNTQLDSLPLSPTSPSPTQGRLFGQPLSAVCSPDHGLPKPVMDMLAFLYLEGPYTRGIFRRSAGAKACRELRDRLDSGTEDPEIKRQSVFVIAAVLKDFLRNIPGGILCVDLYHQWVDVLEGEGEEERLSSIQSLLPLLPGENLLLLRHVIAVLHCIQGNAHDNQMNAFNLSVCIAPSMLWPPAPSTPEMEGEATKKVCELVRLFIDNCCSVLGDVASLFRTCSQKSSGSDHGSDASSFQLNDSSYDSLENELNDDPESPYQEPLPLRDKDKPDSCSRDSVITLSDGDPEPDADGELLLQLPPLARPRRFSPVARQPRTRQVGCSSQAPRRLRRSSEPALALAGTPSSSALLALAESRRQPPRKASYDAAMEGEGQQEDEVFLEQGLGRLQLQEERKEESQSRAARVPSGGRRKTKHAPPPPLRLDASCSSLSSPATSPTGSSLSSLDSAFSQYSTDYGVGGGAALQQSPRDSPPQREAAPHWPPAPGQSHSLHPNTWLKRELCLSLRQPETGHTEEAVAVNGHSHPASNGHTAAAAQEAAETNQSGRRSSSPPSYHQALLQLQRGRCPFYRAADKALTVKELRLLHDQPAACRPPPSPTRPQTGAGAGGEGESVQPPQGVFFGQSPTALILHRPKSHSLIPPLEVHKGRKTLPRRASEPTKLPAKCQHPASLTLDRARPPAPRAPGVPAQDGRLRVPDVEPSHASSSHPCLSPSSTRAVRDYFSSQGKADSDACLRRSQEVVLAIVQSKEEWRSRRCSDPQLEDFEQLFFAEESYV